MSSFMHFPICATYCTLSFHVSDVRAGRQSARVVPRPCRLPLDRLPRAARGGVRADGRANHAQKAERG